ncbi:MAG: TetR-like C-terminal domain-containing protein [Thermomicrobiales bacterium]
MPRAGVDRAAVARAAATLADAEGLDAVTFARLAGQLGVRPPSLYNHVASLAEVRRDITLLGARELGARLARATAGKAGDPALVALATAYRRFASAHPGRYAALQRAPDPADDELATVAGEIVAIVADVLAAYDLRGDDAIHAVRGLRSALHGFVTLEAGGGFEMPLDRDESFARLVRLFSAGLRAGWSRGVVAGEERRFMREEVAAEQAGANGADQLHDEVEIVDRGQA